MSDPSPRPRVPLAPLALVTAVLAVAGAVLALARPWGDVGVSADGALDDGRPVLAVTVLGIGALLAVAVAGAAVRDARWVRAPGRLLGAGSAVTVVGAGGLVVVLGVLGAQVLPLDGGWFALAGAAAVVISGLAVALSPPAARLSGARSARVGTGVVTVLVPVALVVAGVVVAPGWSGHRLDAAYPASFAEAPGPATVTRVAWREPLPPGTVTAVLGGRAVVARDVETDGRCSLQVRALDAGTGDPVWSVTRPLRCDGPRLVGLDGDNQVVRLTLRPAAGDAGYRGPGLTVVVALETGRPLSPSAALDEVVAWTEGFAVVVTGGEVRGLDPQTGATVWARPLPRCADGRAATVGRPAPLPTDRPGSRTPYDGARPPGAVPVVATGRYVVLGTTCAGGGTTVRQAWFVDAVQGADTDVTLTLPSVGGDGDLPTTFLPWLDTVVAALPAPGTGGAGDDVVLVGLDLATGRVLWQRPAASTGAVDLSPTTGDVRVSEGGDRAVTTTLAVRTGAVLQVQSDAGPVTASVALTAARVELVGDRTLTVTDPTARRPAVDVDLGGCVVTASAGTTPMLPGPGGVVLRCTAPGTSGDVLVGLTP